MKKVQLNSVSDKLDSRIMTMKDNDEWNMAKATISEAYSIIVDAMSTMSKDFETMQKYTSILIMLGTYQEYLDLFHEEANRE